MNPEKPCWVIASEKDDDYRNFFNICRDCIVFLIMADNCVLSNREIKNIVEAKTTCIHSRTKENAPHNPGL